jgi:hypothetical protein
MKSDYRYSLWNLGGENVQPSADNNVKMDTALRQGATTTTTTAAITQPTQVAQPTQ